MSWPIVREEQHCALIAAEKKISASGDGVELVCVLEQTPTDGCALKPERFAVEVCQSEDFLAAGHGDPAGVVPSLSVFLPRLSTAFLPVELREAAGHSTAMELHDILARVEHRLQVTGLNETAASKQAGKPDAIRNLRRAVKENGRQGMSTATLKALADVLETTAIWLLAGAGPEERQRVGEEASPHGTDVSFKAVGGERHVFQVKSQPGVEFSKLRLVRATYAGIVEAGSFREVADYDDLVHEAIYEPCDQDYPGCQLLVFDVRGDSMNALVPRPILDGDRVIALDFEGLKGRVPLRTGMIVVVQQTKDGGHLIERSVKQLEVYEDRYEFHPRSAKKKYKPIIVPHNMDPNDGQEVRILGWARRFSNSL